MREAAEATGKPRNQLGNFTDAEDERRRHSVMTKVGGPAERFFMYLMKFLRTGNTLAEAARQNSTSPGSVSVDVRHVAEALQDTLLHESREARLRCRGADEQILGHIMVERRPRGRTRLSEGARSGREGSEGGK